MKRPANRTTQQLNLPLDDAPAAAVPGGKQRDLAVALMELLISAARASIEEQENGGEDEPKAER